MDGPNPYRTPKSAPEGAHSDAAVGPDGYRTAPIPSTKMPPGIPFIVGNEAAERFSYYGMRTILVIFMTQYLRNAAGQTAPMSEAEAKGYYHLFMSAAYFFPVFGAILSDIWLGKYRTIMLLSLVYCLGHLALALDETRLGLFAGLVLIAVGSGGIKPCVSAHVGDQFGASNQHLLERVFGWFYFAINFGAFFSSLATPWLLQSPDVKRWFGIEASPALAFGVPGVLMFLATVVFWCGRNRYVHVPPSGMSFLKEATSPEGRRAIVNLTLIYVFIAVFWCLYDQTGSAWVLQAKGMDLQFLGVHWLESQIQAINPLLILAFIPLFSYVVYPAIERVFPLTPLRKISLGLFLTAASFVISALIEHSIAAGGRPSIVWQVAAYVVLTAAEVMVSITALEFSYTQAPKGMKSFIMSLYLLSVSAGNLLASGVNFALDNLKGADGGPLLSGPGYYWFFTGLMFVTAVLFIVVAANYRGQRFIQDEG